MMQSGNKLTKPAEWGHRQTKICKERKHPSQPAQAHICRLPRWPGAAQHLQTLGPIIRHKVEVRPESTKCLNSIAEFATAHGRLPTLSA